MSSQKKGPFSELLVLVHPNWLEHATAFGLEKQRAREHMKELYSVEKPQAIDWNRYRKAMFDAYGRAIIEAANRPDVFVAIFAIPMKLVDYRAIIEKNPAKIKKSEYSDILRLVAFAKKLLGRRLIVINSPTLAGLQHDVERLCNTIVRKKIDFKKNFVIRGGGEISTGCVKFVVNELKLRLRPSHAYVDKSICGDVLAGVPQRRIVRHTQRELKRKMKQVPRHQVRI